MSRPAICYYKLLNVSTTSNPKEIKKSYYKLAKKYHPDALKAAQKSEEEEKSAKTAAKEAEEHEKRFKQITEAYSILGDTDLRKKYDRLIFGESSVDETSSSFDNQDQYTYWKNKGE